MPRTVGIVVHYIEICGLERRLTRLAYETLFVVVPSESAVRGADGLPPNEVSAASTIALVVFAWPPRRWCSWCQWGWYRRHTKVGGLSCEGGYDIFVWG